MNDDEVSGEPLGLEDRIGCVQDGTAMGSFLFRRASAAQASRTQSVEELMCGGRTRREKRTWCRRNFNMREFRERQGTVSFEQNHSERGPL